MQMGPERSVVSRPSLNECLSPPPTQGKLSRSQFQATGWLTDMFIRLTTTLELLGKTMLGYACRKLTMFPQRSQGGREDGFPPA